MENETIAGMAEVSDLIRSYTYPSIRCDANRRPTLFASCVFLQVDELVNLVTAGLALKGSNGGLMTSGRIGLFDVIGQGGTAEGIDSEAFDIAALKISSATVDEHGLRVIPSSMLATVVEVEHPHSRAVCARVSMLLAA